MINIFFYFFLHTTSQHNIHSKQTKQNNRHILNILRVQSKGRERGREKEKTKVIPLYNHVCYKDFSTFWCSHHLRHLSILRYHMGKKQTNFDTTTCTQREMVAEWVRILANLVKSRSRSSGIKLTLSVFLLIAHLQTSPVPLVQSQNRVPSISLRYGSTLSLSPESQVIFHQTTHKPEINNQAWTSSFILQETNVSGNLTQALCS